MQRTLLCIAWLVASGSVQAGDEWADWATTGPFVCRSEVPLPQRVVLLRELQQLRSDVEKTLGLPPSGDAVVEISLFRDRASYVRHISQRYPAGSKRRALYVKGPDRGRVYVVLGAQFETDLRHEVTHALLHNALPFLPMWLDEGLAEYFEVPRNRRVHDHPHLRRLRWPVRLGWRPELSTLENKHDWSELDSQDYREAWAWVHFLLHGPPEAREVLCAYVQSILTSAPPGPLSTHLTRRVTAPGRCLTQHLKAIHANVVSHAFQSVPSDRS